MISSRSLLFIAISAVLAASGCSPSSAPVSDLPPVARLPAASSAITTHRTSGHERLAQSYVYVVKPSDYVRDATSGRYQRDSSTYIEARTELNTSAEAGYYSQQALEARGAAVTSWQQLKINGQDVSLVTARFGGEERQAVDPNPREIMGLVWLGAENYVAHLDGVYRAGDTATARITRQILLSAWLDEAATAAQSARANQKVREYMKKNPDGPPPAPGTSAPID